MTEPIVPEQGLRDAAQRLESRAAAQGITVLEAELQDAVIAARRELNRLCGGGKWQMTIPVDLQRDSDVILGNLVALADKLVFESEKRGAALERPRPALPAPEPTDDPGRTLDLILIAGTEERFGEEPDVARWREIVESWTPEQRDQVENFCGAIHLRASDNDDVIVPSRPVILDQLGIPGPPQANGEAR